MVLKGYKQTPEHIAKRIKRGPDHHHWQGKRVSVRGGRARALRLYPDIGPCELCGNPRSERHHVDENTANNEPSNIAIICRRCHMRTDGRLKRLSEQGKERIGKLIVLAANKRWANDHCPQGHIYSGKNNKGVRICKTCNRDCKRRKRTNDNRTASNG
jgi:hypothetical protein